MTRTADRSPRSSRRHVRSLPLLLLSAVAVAATTSAMAACSDSEGSATSTDLPDASAGDASNNDTDAGADAASSSDAGADTGGDGGADATPDAGPLGVVHVVVADRAPKVPVPASGMDVVFHDPTGAVTRAVTDANGRADGNVHAGATVTVVWRQFSDYIEITSVVGVALDDTIEVTFEPSGFPEATTLAMNAAAPPGVEAGTEYRFYDGRGGSGGNYAPSAYTRSGADAYLVDRTGLRLLGFSPAAFAPVITPTKYAVCLIPKQADGGVGTGEVLAADWADVAAGPLALTGSAPLDATKWTWSLQHAHVDGFFPLLALEAQPPASATLPASYARVPATAAEHVYVESALLFPTSTSSRIRRMPSTGTVTEDLGAYLPAITGATATGPTASPTLSWTTAAAVGPTTGWHVLAGTRPNPEGGTIDTEWRVVHRATTSTVAFPALPADLQGVLPTTAWKPVVVSLFDAPTIPFETVRTKIGAQQQRLNASGYAYPRTPFVARFVRFTQY